MEQDTSLLQGLCGPLLQCLLAEQVPDMVGGELASAGSLSGRSDIHERGGYDCQRPGLAVADVQDLGYVYELCVDRVSGSEAGRSKLEDLCQPLLFLLKGYPFLVGPLALYIAHNIFICNIEFKS